MIASLVYDGTIVRTPRKMGTPRADQMQGTPLEGLSELCCRVCYDSLGTGRDSAALHRHILEVLHLSVYRHAAFTITFPDCGFPGELALCCLNRKGVRVDYIDRALEITANLQSVVEWGRYPAPLGDWNDDMGDVLRWYANLLAPRVVPRPTNPELFDLLNQAMLKEEGLTEDQAHVSLFLSGSRGFSHEQVRHNFAVSQRSTRYCDEDGTPYVEHPLTAAYLASGHPGVNLCRAAIEQSVAADRKTYRALVAYLEEWLLGRGIGKLDARKQARGAARGYLGNALTTEMIFTAPVSGWRWMLSQRKSRFADAEIREIYSPVLKALKGCRYGGYFEDLDLAPSPDGLGEVLAA